MIIKLNYFKKKVYLNKIMKNPLNLKVKTVLNIKAI